jgi:hypothetical protein
VWRMVVCRFGLLSCGLLVACGSNVMSSTGTAGSQGGTGEGGSSQPCQPQLHVPFQVVDNATDVPITCGAAGAGDVELDINGADTVTYVQACVATDTDGEFSVVLSTGGRYTLDVFLTDTNNAVLSEAHTPTIDVGCPSFTTETVILPVN